MRARPIPPLSYALPPYVSVRRLARLLGVCEATVNRWVEKRWLPLPARVTPTLSAFQTARVRDALDKLRKAGVTIPDRPTRKRKPWQPGQPPFAPRPPRRRRARR